jgi:hypothetical protein
MPKQWLLVDVSDYLFECGRRDAKNACVGPTKLKDEEYREGDADRAKRQGGDYERTALGEETSRKEQHNRPDQEDNHQAGAYRVTGDLQVNEDATVLYLICERVG